MSDQVVKQNQTILLIKTVNVALFHFGEMMERYRTCTFNALLVCGYVVKKKESYHEASLIIADFLNSGLVWDLSVILWVL